MRLWLKKYRRNAHLTQNQVATHINKSRQYYNEIESGKRGNNLPVKTAKAISEVLGFDWQRFYEDEATGTNSHT